MEAINHNQKPFIPVGEITKSKPKRVTKWIIGALPIATLTIATLATAVLVDLPIAALSKKSPDSLFAEAPAIPIAKIINWINT